MSHGSETFLGSTSRLNLGGQIVEELGQRIASGYYGAAGVLPNEAALSDELSVRSSIIREAAKQLSAKGLVEIRSRTGTRVLPQDRWNLLDISSAANQQAWPESRRDGAKRPKRVRD